MDAASVALIGTLGGTALGGLISFGVAALNLRSQETGRRRNEMRESSVAFLSAAHTLKKSAMYVDMNSQNSVAVDKLIKDAELMQAAHERLDITNTGSVLNAAIGYHQALARMRKDVMAGNGVAEGVLSQVRDLKQDLVAAMRKELGIRDH